MNKLFKAVISVVLTVFLLCSTGLCEEYTGEKQYKYINQLADFVVGGYKFGVTKDVLINAAFKDKLTNENSNFESMVSAMMSSLDEHSSFMTEQEYSSLLQHSIYGTFAGIGVTISHSGDRFIVINSIIDSPAYKAGIMANDVIVAVDGEDVTSLPFEALREKIVGPVGTLVSVTVERDNQTITFRLFREIVKENNVHYEVLEDGIGYIKMTNFNQGAVEDLIKALDDFEGQGISKIILDIRDNPGGEFTSALQVCRLFAPKGVIARIEYKDSSKNELFYCEDGQKGKYNLAVLINENSASASELFAGTVKDTSSGVIIGTTSYGKGTMQKLYPLSTGGAARLTVAEFKSAGARTINKVGVAPDIYVENTTKVSDTSYFKEIEFGQDYNESVSGTGVLALEQRLEFLGYFESEPDEIFDRETTEAVRTFQALCGLDITGVADVYTLIELNDFDYNMPFLVDLQLEKAIECLGE